MYKIKILPQTRLAKMPKALLIVTLILLIASFAACSPAVSNTLTENGAAGSSDNNQPGNGQSLTPLTPANEADSLSTPVQLTPTPAPTPSPTPAPTPEPTPTPIPVYRARIAFTGDLMVHEPQLTSAYQKESGTYHFSSFEAVTAYLQDADYTVGNFETTQAGAEAGYGTYPLFNAPDTFSEAVKAAGFDFVSTTNNHCMDKREKGLLRTLEVLDAAGLDHAGTYASAEAQEKIFIQEINQIRVAFLAYTYGTNGIPVPADKPWLVNLLDRDLMRRQIEQARAEGADMVVVLPHMGNEYQEKAPDNMVALARSLCDWGADAVMASHPHVLQPAEVYETVDEAGQARTCFIAYSMGNFVSSQRTEPREVGAVFYLDIEKTSNEGRDYTYITRASFAPTWVSYMNDKGQYDIRVLPLHDTLTALENGDNLGLRPKDVTRLRAVHRQTTKKMLGAEIPWEESQAIYNLYERANVPPMRAG